MAPRRHDFNENRKNKIKTGCRITGASDNHELFWQRITRMNTDEHGRLPFPNDFWQRMTRIVRHRTTRTTTDGVPGGGQHDEPRAHGTVMARAIAMTSTGPGARGLCVYHDPPHTTAAIIHYLFSIMRSIRHHYPFSVLHSPLAKHCSPFSIIYYAKHRGFAMTGKLRRDEIGAITGNISSSSYIKPQHPA